MKTHYYRPKVTILSPKFLMHRDHYIIATFIIFILPGCFARWYYWFHHVRQSVKNRLVKPSMTLPLNFSLIPTQFYSNFRIYHNFWLFILHYIHFLKRSLKHQIYIGTIIKMLMLFLIEFNWTKKSLCFKSKWMLHKASLIKWCIFVLFVERN